MKKGVLAFLMVPLSDHALFAQTEYGLARESITSREKSAGVSKWKALLNSGMDAFNLFNEMR